MLKYRIFFIAWDGRVYDAFKSEFIPEDIDFDCIDDAIFHLAIWDKAGSVNDSEHIKYTFLPVYVR